MPYMCFHSFCWWYLVPFWSRSQSSSSYHKCHGQFRHCFFTSFTTLNCTKHKIDAQVNRLARLMANKSIWAIWWNTTVPFRLSSWSVIPLQMLSFNPLSLKSRCCWSYSTGYSEASTTNRSECNCVKSGVKCHVTICYLIGRSFL